MASGDPTVLNDFRRGVNLQTGPYLLESSEARDARNVHGTVVGSIKKRPGFEKLGTDAFASIDGAPHSLFAANLSPTKFLIAVAKQAGAANDRIISVDPTGVPATLASTLTQGRRWSFVQGPTSGGEGPIWGVNGVDVPKQWTGSGAMGNWTATTGTVPQTARFLAYQMDVIWAAGFIDAPAKVASCGLTAGGTPVPDPRNWSTDYADQVEPNDGEPLTGLGTYGPYLLVFKARQLYALADFQARNYRKISSGIGCVAHRSIAETSAGTMFLSEDLGVCVTDGQEVTPISDPILPLLREAADANALLFDDACATYHRGSYFLSIPSAAAYNDLTLEYQLDTRSWWIHTCASNQFALVDPTGSPILYSANPTLKQVDKAFVEGVYSDYGQSYEAYWKSPFLVWGNPHVNKRIRQFRADGQGQWDLYSQETFDDDETLLDMEIWEDTDDPFYFGGTGTFGDGSDEFMPSGGITQRRYPTPSQGWGRAWSLIVRADDPNPMQLFSIAAFVLPRRD